MSNSSQLLWQDTAWKEQVREWIQVQTQNQGILITGEIEQPHMYAWSTVLHMPTDQGKLFFKATAHETLYEAALTQALAAWFPESMPEFVAVDARRGWMLMRDGGDQLRASIRPTKDISPWKPVIKRYAEVQIGLAEHVTEMLSLRTPDRRLSILPDLFSQLLAEEPSFLIDQEKGLTSAEWQEVKDKATRFEEICQQLTAYGIPDSLNHGDFHDGNILVKNGRITFFDWGDGDITHPFVSLRNLFVSIEIALDLADYSFTPEMAELLDLYLEPFQKFTSRENLHTAYQVSRPVATVVKALAWHTTISRMGADLRKEYAWILPELMKEFLYHEKNSTG